MKKKKLRLRKTTIRNLTAEGNLRHVAGGTNSQPENCPTLQYQTGCTDDFTECYTECCPCSGGGGGGFGSHFITGCETTGCS